MKTGSVIALLPMKAHSERVPGKNMRPFAGRPLYRRIMESLLASRYISGVVVNTDGAAIKEDIEKNFGARVVVHDRPAVICGDFVPMNDIIADDIKRLEGEHFLQTHATNPLLKPATIDAAVERYFEALKEGFDSLFSVTRFQSRFYSADGRPINHDPKRLARTQDLAPVFEENSCIYIFSRGSFGAASRRIGGRPLMFEVVREEAVDIDEEADFKWAEALAKAKKPV